MISIQQSHKETSRFGFLFLLLFTMCGVPKSTFADFSGIKPEPEGEISAISEIGAIKLKDGRVIFLWGVVPQSGYIRYFQETLVGKTVRCQIPDNQKIFGKPKTTTPSYLVCFRSGSGGGFENSLAAELVRANVAEPFCIEAHSFYPSCIDKIK